LIDVVGIGETPIGSLATFSLWESRAAARAFAYAMPEHREVIERTRAEDWYAEEMFARFEPYGSTGTWGGRDPLAAS
jgi:heme-degrading monooxygenase HmoA